MGDLDLDGGVTLADRVAILDRHVNANSRAAEPVAPGIEMLDADGDADFDENDVLTIGSPCTADIALPVGVLDLGDVNAFVGGFLSQNPIADLNEDGVYDLGDLGAFVGGFNAGCP